ncbi:hypothetical protein SAY87_022769 [Trapa incisa]|uniref:Uncharacterized protein n=1 Tax=Trapa incisa TaxID=236973 RepID=A0AAN7K8C1_9MYRT|nr:hypothetical protein SAY87_022769 [Trapa incisa]
MAKEMSQETESRRRSQSVISRLMGLEGPPLQQPSQRQQRMCSRLMANEMAGGSSPFSSRRSVSRSFKEVKQFKDVFEVVEASKVNSRSDNFEGFMG